VDGGIGQFYASVALSCGKMFPVSIYYEAGWVPEWYGCCGEGKNLKLIHEILEQLPGR